MSHDAWLLNQAIDSVRPASSHTRQPPSPFSLDPRPVQVAAVTAAVDLHKVRDASNSIYTGTLACLAAANSVGAY
jgi:hypothetical protein